MNKQSTINLDEQRELVESLNAVSSSLTQIAHEVGMLTSIEPGALRDLSRRLRDDREALAEIVRDLSALKGA